MAEEPIASLEEIRVRERCAECGASITYEILRDRVRACGVCGALPHAKLDIDLAYVRALEELLNRALRHRNDR